MEKITLKQINRVLESFIHLPYITTHEQVVTWHPHQVGQLGKILRNHILEVYAAGQASGDVLTQNIRKKFEKIKLSEDDNSADNGPFHEKFIHKPEKLAKDLWLEDEWFKPHRAIKALEARELVLAGNWESDIITSIKQVILQSLEGRSNSEVKMLLKAILKTNLNRAELILTTETTYAYNRGRLSSFKENDVDYIRFSAVMDARTSQVCQSRNGLIMSMSDPSLSSNTPPLHGRCRSVLTPLYSKYQPELIQEDKMNWDKVKPIPKGWRTG